MKRTALLFLAALVYAEDAARVTLNTSLPLSASASLTTINGHPINQATDSVYWIFQMPEAVTITTMGFRYNLRTGTPVQHRISIQGVDLSNGRNDGTVSASAAFTPPADTSWDATFQFVTITHDGAGGSLSSVALTRGAFYALVIEPCPGSTAPCLGAATPDGSNSSEFGHGSLTGSAGATQGFPYAATNDNGTHAKQTRWPIFALRSATKTYGTPVVSVAATAISTGSDQAIRFTLPAGWGATFRVAGVRFVATSPSSGGGSVNLNLYSGTTVLQSVTWDTDINRANNGQGNIFEFYFDEAALSTLASGTTYRLGVTPVSGGSVGLSVMTLPAASDRTAYPGGTNFGWSTRASCGGACDATSTAWTDDDTKRPLVELILEDLTGGGGAAGGSYTFIGGEA